jgi:polyhydroxyalkanoate synthesis regulator phasin
MADDKKSESSITDVIKKVVSIGVGAAFMTEDAVKTILSDLPLPKDIITGLIQNAKGAKKEFSDGIRSEIREYLSKLDVTKVVESTLEKYDFDVQAKVSLRRKDQAKEVKESGKE